LRRVFGGEKAIRVKVYGLRGRIIRQHGDDHITGFGKRTQARRDRATNLVGQIGGLALRSVPYREREARGGDVSRHMRAHTPKTDKPHLHQATCCVVIPEIA
jgi:hypothetical protein